MQRYVVLYLFCVLGEFSLLELFLLGECQGSHRVGNEAALGPVCKLVPEAKGVIGGVEGGAAGERAFAGGDLIFRRQEDMLVACRGAVVRVLDFASLCGVVFWGLSTSRADLEGGWVGGVLVESGQF
jgi:hypothetical protein